VGRLKEGQAVKHTKRKIHEARCVGYTESGRVRVVYNEIYPRGVSWAVGYFKAENIIPN
jgi:hypothetical protein